MARLRKAFIMPYFLLSLWCAAAEENSTSVNEAQEFIESLSEEQKNKTCLALDDADRINWNFLPNEFVDRKGVVIGDLSKQQRARFMDLLKTTLSEDGYQKVTGVMDLEEVLFKIEKNSNIVRDRDGYFINFFGEPKVRNNWAWSFEGHHLSINLNLKGNMLLSFTPSFLGANPADEKLSGRPLLQMEEELARALAQSLDDRQKKAGLVSTKAKGDIKTSAQNFIFKEKGISGDRLNKAQLIQLKKLIFYYIDVYDASLTAELRESLNGTNDADLFFAWKGGLKENDPHQYVIHTPTFFIEYVNIQGKADHIHCVIKSVAEDR